MTCIRTVVFSALVLVTASSAIAGLNELPADVLLKIADHLENSNDVDALDLTSSVIHGKMSSQAKRPLKAARIRSLFPTQTTTSGAVFRRRVDLELHYFQAFKKKRKVFKGEIWQEPSHRGKPGLVWFPLEKVNNRPILLNSEEAQKYCSEKYAIVGIQAGTPNRTQLEHTYRLMTEMESGPLGVRSVSRFQILPDLEVEIPNFQSMKSLERTPVRCVYEPQGKNQDMALTTGAVFTRRIDLETRFSRVRVGEIWQEPSAYPAAGLVWFSIEQENNLSLRLSFDEAKSRCAWASEKLGISLRVPRINEAQEYGYQLHTRSNSVDSSLDHPVTQHCGNEWWVENETGAGRLVYNSLSSLSVSVDQPNSGFVRCVFSPNLF